MREAALIAIGIYTRRSDSLFYKNDNQIDFQKVNPCLEKIQSQESDGNFIGLLVKLLNNDQPFESFAEASYHSKQMAITTKDNKIKNFINCQLLPGDGRYSIEESFKEYKFQESQY